MIKKLGVLLSIFIFALPITGYAHDGHGLFNGGEVIHYFSSPLHVIPILLALALGIWIFAKRRKVHMSKL